MKKVIIALFVTGLILLILEVLEIVVGFFLLVISAACILIAIILWIIHKVR